MSKKDEKAVPAITFVAEGFKATIPGNVATELAQGMAAIGKGYGHYRKIAIPFVEAFGTDCLTVGSAANKAAILFIKKQNPLWADASATFEKLSKLTERTETQQAQFYGARGARDDQARVCANAFNRIRFYWEDAQDKGEEDGSKRSRKMPRALLEEVVAKLTKIEESKNVPEADKKLARSGVAAIRAVLGGSFVPPLVTAKATPAKVGAEGKMPSAVTHLDPQEYAAAQ